MEWILNRGQNRSGWREAVEGGLAGRVAGRRRDVTLRDFP